MNQQERDSLNQFLTQLREVHLQRKDAEAEALIRAAVAQQPDSAYLLVQRALLANQALEALKTQNAQLQAELQEQKASGTGASGSGSFLGNNPWASNSVAKSPVPGANTYQMPAAAAPANGPASGGVSSFLGSVATTAAGVAAGSFLFHGIENLLGHHPMGGWGHEGYGPEPMAENTVINNYYVTEQPEQGGLPEDQDMLVNSDGDSYTSDSDDSTWV